MNETAANQPAHYSPTEPAATQHAIAPPPPPPDAMQPCNTNDYAALSRMRPEGETISLIHHLTTPEARNTAQTTSEYAAPA